MAMGYYLLWRVFYMQTGATFVSFYVISFYVNWLLKSPTPPCSRIFCFESQFLLCNFQVIWCLLRGPDKIKYMLFFAAPKWGISVQFSQLVNLRFSSTNIIIWLYNVHPASFQRIKWLQTNCKTILHLHCLPFNVKCMVLMQILSSRLLKLELLIGWWKMFTYPKSFRTTVFQLSHVFPFLPETIRFLLD